MPRNSTKKTVSKNEVKAVKATQEKTKELTTSSSQVIRGRVVSVKSAKTAVVMVESTKKHPVYQKSFLRSKRYLVHDEKGVKEGDIVEMIKVRPVSKNKHWSILKVVGRDIEAIVSAELKEEAAQAISEVIPERVETEEETSEVEEKTKGEKA